MKVSKKALLKGMYTFLKNLICSVLFLSIIVSVLTFYMPLFRDEEQKPVRSVLTDFYEEDKDIAEIVFVGSSALYRFVAPTQIYSDYGVVTLNYAAGALDIAPTCAVIDEVIKYQHPKIIAIEMRNYVNNSEEYMSGNGHTEFQMLEKESYFDKFINSMPLSRNRMRVINDTVPTTLKKSTDEVLEYQFEYFTTHHNWKNLTYNDFVEYTEERLNSDSPFYYQDQVKMVEKYYNNDLDSQPLTTEIDEETGEEYTVPYEFPVYKGTPYKGTIAVSSYAYQIPVDYTNYEERKRIDGYWLEMLENIMKKAKSCGTEIVFFTSPHLLTETEMAYENTMADILTQNGFDFICGNKLIHDIGLDFEEDYYDDMHVNVRGMVKFTEYISDYLINKYDIEKSELTEEQKAEWDLASENWISEVKEPGIENVNKKIAKYKPIRQKEAAKNKAVS